MGLGVLATLLSLHIAWLSFAVAEALRGTPVASTTPPTHTPRLMQEVGAEEEGAAWDHRLGRLLPAHAGLCAWLQC